MADGAGLRVEIAGETLVERGSRLVIPPGELYLAR
jgi:hypothetical protein